MDATNYVTGTACVCETAPVPDFEAVFGTIDHSALPPFADAYLECYIYIDDLANIQESRISLNSSGIADINEISHGFIGSINLSNGWNYISLKLTDFYNDDGDYDWSGGSKGDLIDPFDYSQLLGFRFYLIVAQAGTTNTVRFDNIILTNTPKIDQVRAHGIYPKSTSPTTINMVVSDAVVNKDRTPYIIMLSICGGLAVILAASGVFILLRKPRHSK